MNRVTDPADPRRCKTSFKHEQCWNESAPGSDHCIAHGGVSKAESESTRLYLLAEARNRTRLAELSEHEHIKSLREEIALARMLIERRLNSITTDAELLAASGQINTMLLTLERLVKSAHSIELNLGALLAKTSVLKLGQAMCEIVVEELQGVEGYEEIIDRITTRLLATISDAKNPPGKAA